MGNPGGVGVLVTQVVPQPQGHTPGQDNTWFSPQAGAVQQACGVRSITGSEKLTYKLGTEKNTWRMKSPPYCGWLADSSMLSVSVKKICGKTKLPSLAVVTDPEHNLTG